MFQLPLVHPNHHSRHYLRLLQHTIASSYHLSCPKTHENLVSHDNLNQLPKGYFSYRASTTEQGPSTNNTRRYLPFDMAPPLGGHDPQSQSTIQESVPLDILSRDHLPSDMATQSSPGGHAPQPQPAVRQSVSLNTLSEDHLSSDMATQPPPEDSPQPQSAVQQSVSLDTLSEDHLLSDVASQPSSGGHSQSQSAIQQSVSLLSGETTHNEYRAASNPRPTQTSWRRRWLCHLSILFVYNISSLVWGFFSVYSSIFPLSAVDRTVNATTLTSNIFNEFQTIWIGACVLLNFLYSFLWARSSLSESDDVQLTLPAERPSNLAWRPFNFVIKVMTFILYFALLSIPSWWYRPLQAGWQRAVWRHEACLGWELSITMRTLHFNEIGVPGKLSSATLLDSNGSEFAMALSHPASNISVISLYAGSNSTPSEVVFNFTTLTYATSTNLSGSFTNSPVLSFPELSLRSQYPRIDWSFDCSAPRVSLIDSDNHVVLRTRAKNYDDCTQLRACGSGDIETLILPLSVTLIELENAGLCYTNPFL